MSAVLDFLGRVLNLLLQLLGVSQAILGTVTDPVAAGHVADEQAGVANIVMIVNDPTYGNPELRVQLNAIEAEVTAAVSSLSLAISNLTDGTTPVSLPVVPPSGYGTPTASAIGDAVWNYEYGLSGRQAGTWLEWSGSGQLRDWVVAVDLPYSPRWLPLLWPMEDPGSYTANYPQFNPVDILPGETFLACVIRQNPGAVSVDQFTGNGPIQVTYPSTATLYTWVSAFDGNDFAGWARLAGVTGLSMATPVWPGLANVTLGSPIAMTTGDAVTIDCDGVIVNMSSVPAKLGNFSFGTESSYRNLGALSFQSDNGQMERAQTLGFTDCLYVPLSMSHAVGFAYRTQAGVVGTITPFVLL